MTQLNKDFFQETMKIALGEIQRSPLLTELSDFFEKTYSVKILNFEFTKFHVPNSNRHKLYITIQNADDYKKMYKSILKPIEEYQKQIALEFQKLALKHQFAKEEQLEDIWVVYNDFSDEAKTEINRKANKEFSDHITKAYPSVWDTVRMFSGMVVFYFTDNDISANEASGTSEETTDDYYTILNKHDELNYFTRENIAIKFDSKENVDNNFGGSIFFYTR